MKNKRLISCVCVLVKDYDEAIDYYQNALGFTLIEDSDRGAGKRWVLVAPSAESETRLLLAKAVTAEQQQQVGNQTGSRVFLFLQTGDFWRDYARFKSAGVNFLEEPRDEDYAIVVKFRDLYGNGWDLLQMKDG